LRKGLVQYNPSHGNTSIKKHLMNEHLKDFAKYKVESEFVEGGVEEGG
jgi:hypothetical protein